MLLDQGVVAVIGDGVEVQVERPAAFEPEPAHGIEPESHQFRVASRVDAATVLRQEGPLGNGVQPGEEGQPFVEHGAHDVGMARGAEELQGEQGAEGAARRDDAGGRRVVLQRRDAVERDRGQGREEQEQPAEAGAQLPRGQVELPDVGGVGRGGPGSRRALVVGALGEAGEPFGLEDVGDGDRAERAPLVVQRAADVVDREVLLAQLDDPIAEGIGLGGGMRPLGRGDEEGTFGIPAELVDEDAEAARGVAEAACRLDPEPLDEVGPQASYCRWVALAGSVNRRERSVSSLAEPVNMLPPCQVAGSLKRPP